MVRTPVYSVNTSQWLKKIGKINNEIVNDYSITTRRHASSKDSRNKLTQSFTQFDDGTVYHHMYSDNTHYITSNITKSHDE